MSLDLSRIRVLYRSDSTLSLWGIPYEMRADVGQQPRDLLLGYDEALQRWRRSLGKVPEWGNPAPRDPRADWFWLGQPGWWGSLPKESQGAIEAWLARPEIRQLVPGNPHEWSRVPGTESQLSVPGVGAGARVEYLEPTGSDPHGPPTLCAAADGGARTGPKGEDLSCIHAPGHGGLHSNGLRTWRGKAARRDAKPGLASLEDGDATRRLAEE